MTRRGQFITFEGTEGVGKSTQLANAAGTLDALGVDYIVTREPGGTPMAESIRELLLGHDALDQAGADRRMIEADGTDNKAQFGVIS